MELNEYENPDDRYAPRARASQEVAAAKRAQHHDAEPITPLVLPARTRQYVPFGIGALVLILLMVGAASYQLGHMPTTPLAITPGPSTAAFLAAPSPEAPQASPAPTSEATAVPSAISAYAAPDGLLLGQIELDRTITPVAHFGSAWLQADVEGSGLVWLRAGDVPDIALTGPDLAPAAQQPSGQGVTINQSDDNTVEWTPPPATPAPAFGQKEAPDRAAQHAAAVARDQPHGQKGP